MSFVFLPSSPSFSHSHSHFSYDWDSRSKPKPTDKTKTKTKTEIKNSGGSLPHSHSQTHPHPHHEKYSYPHPYKLSYCSSSSSHSKSPISLSSRPPFFRYFRREAEFSSYSTLRSTAKSYSPHYLHSHSHFPIDSNSNSSKSSFPMGLCVSSMNTHSHSHSHGPSSFSSSSPSHDILSKSKKREREMEKEKEKEKAQNEEKDKEKEKYKDKDKKKFKETKDIHYAYPTESSMAKSKLTEKGKERGKFPLPKGVKSSISLSSALSLIPKKIIAKRKEKEKKKGKEMGISVKSKGMEMEMETAMDIEKEEEVGEYPLKDNGHDDDVIRMRENKEKEKGEEEGEGEGEGEDEKNKSKKMKMDSTASTLTPTDAPNIPPFVAYLSSQTTQTLLLAFPLLSQHVDTALSWSSPSSPSSSWPTVTIPTLSEIQSKMISWRSCPLIDILSQYNLYRFRNYLSTLPVANRKLEICFHGTSAARVPSILTNGLIVPGPLSSSITLDKNTVGHKTDSGFWGRGIYCSPNDSTSAGYATDASGASGGGGFVALVARGKIASIVNRMDGKDCTVGYHSHEARGESEWIIFNSDAVLLLYYVKVGAVSSSVYSYWGASASSAVKNDVTMEGVQKRKDISRYFEEKQKDKERAEREELEVNGLMALRRRK